MKNIGKEIIEEIKDMSREMHRKVFGTIPRYGNESIRTTLDTDNYNIILIKTIRTHMNLATLEKAVQAQMNIENNENDNFNKKLSFYPALGIEYSKKSYNRGYSTCYPTSIMYHDKENNPEMGYCEIIIGQEDSEKLNKLPKEVLEAVRLELLKATERFKSLSYKEIIDNEKFKTLLEKEDLDKDNIRICRIAGSDMYFVKEQIESRYSGIYIDSDMSKMKDEDAVEYFCQHFDIEEDDKNIYIELVK